MLAVQVLEGTMREQILLRQNSLYVEVITILQIFKKNIRKYKDKSCAAGDLDKQRTKGPPRIYFRCGFVDILISKCPKPPKDKDKLQKKIRFNESGNCGLQKKER